MSEKIYTMFPTLAQKPPVAVKAEGVVITDSTGKEYIDFSSGVAVVGIGHGVKEIQEAVYKQMDKFSFVYRGMFASEPLLEASKKIIDFAPEGMARVFFCSGGSEASESAIKIARQYHLECGNTGKYKIISRWAGFHGNTLGTLAVGGRTSWRIPYDPYLVKMPKIPQCNCYHCPLKLEYPACGCQCAHELERTIKAEGADTVAAFMCETVVGAAGGTVVPPKEYFKIIREICDKYNVLMIDDEVITGFGRTGKNFAIQHFGVCPDLIVTAKGMGSGYLPVGGVIVHQKIVDAIEKGSGSLIHSYTYAGHPVACAAVSAVLDYLQEHDLVKAAEEKGRLLKSKLNEMADLPMIGEVRGLGLMAGLCLVKDKKTRESFAPELNVGERVRKRCFENGLVLLAATVGTEDGVKGDALMISPPFIITEEEMDKALAILKEALLYVYEEVMK